MVAVGEFAQHPFSELFGWAGFQSGTTYQASWLSGSFAGTGPVDPRRILLSHAMRI